MTTQLSISARNGLLDGIVAAIGASPVLKVRTGAAPANAAAARTGTVLATVNLPAAWMAASANGTKAKSGTWGDDSADADGQAGHYTIEDSGGVCHLQGSCGAKVAIPTTAATAANGNVLTFAATNGVVVGMNATGAGIPANATVLALTGTTVTLSMAVTGVANGASITFAPDMVVDNAVFAATQKFSVDSYTLTAPNA